MEGLLGIFTWKLLLVLATLVLITLVVAFFSSYRIISLWSNWELERECRRANK